MPSPMQVVHLVRPVVAPQHSDLPIERTGNSLMGSSEAEFVHEHSSDTVGCISCDYWPYASADWTTAGLFTAPLTSKSKQCRMRLLHYLLLDDLGRAMSVRASSGCAGPLNVLILIRLSDGFGRGSRRGLALLLSPFTGPSRSGLKGLGSCRLAAF